MSNDCCRGTVVRRVRLREELKPVNAPWRFGPGRPEPDWLLITHVKGPRGFETFDLQLVTVMMPACGSASERVGLAGTISYETLHIAKAQAHADVGVEYVEWEPCNIAITNEHGSIDWSRALPIAEPGACT